MALDSLEVNAIDRRIAVYASRGSTGTFESILVESDGQASRPVLP